MTNLTNSNQLGKMGEERKHWKEYFNYEYLGAYSLPDGKDITLTISHAQKEEITGSGGKREECLVCHFQEDSKPMILNRTNCKVIEKLYKTAYPSEWGGKRIQLFSKSVTAFGDTTNALRVRDFIPAANDGKADLKKQIREALKVYQGDDVEAIKTTLNEKQQAKEDTLEFLANTLKQIRA